MATSSIEQRRAARGAKYIEHDGRRTLVLPCQVPTCVDYSDPDIDATLLCTRHAAMVPSAMFAALDDASAQTGVSGFERTHRAIIKYAIECDAVIYGWGLDK